MKLTLTFLTYYTLIVALRVGLCQNIKSGTELLQPQETRRPDRTQLSEPKQQNIPTKKERTIILNPELVNNPIQQVKGIRGEDVIFEYQLVEVTTL